MSKVRYRPIPLSAAPRLDLRQLELPAGLDRRALAGDGAVSFALTTERVTIVMPARLAAQPGDVSAAVSAARPWLVLREGALGVAHAYTLDVRPARGGRTARLALLRGTGRIVAEGRARLVEGGRAATFELEVLDGAGRVRPRFRGRLEAGQLKLEATLARLPAKPER